MTLVDTTAKELDTSTASLIADGVVTKLFIEIEKCTAAPIDVSWFNNMLNIVEFSKNIQVGFQHSVAYTLAIIDRHWEELPVEIRSQYGYAFLNFAMQVTGKQRSTVDNYIRTAKIWFIDKTAPRGDVRIAVRDLKGKPTGQYEYKPFNPSLVDMSKLLIVNRRAAAGEMTERLWEMLTDPFYTNEDIARENSAAPLSNGDKPSCYFEAIGPSLLYTSNLETILIAEINWVEYDSNPAVREGIDKLLKLLDVRRDEDAVFKANHKVFVLEGSINES